MDRRNSALDNDGGKAVAVATTTTSESSSYEQKLRTMSTSELVQELKTLEWHYSLFKDEKRYEMLNAIQTEIRRRRAGIAKQQKSE